VGERVIFCRVASGGRRGASIGGEQPATSSSGCGEGASVGVCQATAVCGPSVLSCLKVRGHGVELLYWNSAAYLTGCSRIPDGACAAKLVTGSR